MTINKDRTFFQYNSGDLVYMILLLMSQLCNALRKVIIKYVGSVVIYKNIDPHNYLLMTLDGKILTLSALRVLMVPFNQHQV